MSCSSDANALEGVPTSHLRASGLVDLLDTRVDDLSARGGVWPTDDFPRASLVRESVADLELHRQDAA